jgi:hypothetical protein
MSRNSTNRVTRRAAALAAVLLALCCASVSQAANGAKVAVVSFGLFGGQNVFEREAKGAAAVVAKQFGGDPVIVRANTKSRQDATIESVAATLQSATAGMDAAHDLLWLILTSHGSRSGLAVQFGKRMDILSPPALAAMLAAVPVRHRVVVVSACYSGVFIGPLADADTLVITAADADHPSFGCRDGAQWTYFGDALFNVALRRTANLKDAFALARSVVRARERRNGFAASNPQMAGGQNVEPLLVPRAAALH